MDFKLISKNGEFAAANPKNLNIFNINELEAKILCFCNKGARIQDIASELDVSEEKCREVVETFCNLPDGVQLVPEETGRPRELLLLVSQDCNMRCRYCYAQGGTYGEERILMTKETAFKALDIALSLGEINGIAFFGGEPLLNFELMRQIVNSTKKQNIKYGFVTNGTIMNEEIIEFIKTHNILVTVSIDGPEDVHNANRIYTSEKGTHRKVVETMKMLKSAGISFALEATFSKQVLELGYTATQILEYLYQFSPAIKITNVGSIDDCKFKLSVKELIDFHIQCIDFAFDNLVKGEHINLFDITGFISRVTAPERVIQKGLCPAITQRLTIFPNGDAYPCYMTTGKKFRYGNVFDSDFVKNFQKKSEKIYSMLSRDFLTQSYWFTPFLTDICFGYVTPKDGYFQLDETLAKAFSHIIPYIIFRLSRIEDWNTFFEALEREGAE